jgi:hypothetical protein
MSAALRRLARLVVIAFAALGAVVAMSFALTVADASLSGRFTPTTAPSVAPTPTPGLISMAPGAVIMPADADCKACHETSNGVIGVKDIPVIPHPVARWSLCTACHDNARLVLTAPGHSGIHADQCTVCHTASAGPAPAPAHVAAANARCLECHGKTAPLPSDMSHRPGNLCWLCHLSPAPSGSPSPISAPSPTPG